MTWPTFWKKITFFVVDNFQQFWQFWQFWQLLTIFDSLDNFGEFLHFLRVLTIFDNFWQFWQFWQFFTNFDSFDNFLEFWHFWEFWQFLTILTIFDTGQHSQFLRCFAQVPLFIFFKNVKNIFKISKTIDSDSRTKNIQHNTDRAHIYWLLQL